MEENQRRQTEAADKKKASQKLDQERKQREVYSLYCLLAIQHITISVACGCSILSAADICCVRLVVREASCSCCI